MKKQLNFIIGIIALVGFITAIYFLSTRNINKSDTSNSDAIFQMVVKEYQLNADGSVNYHYYHKVKLLTYNAFHRFYGETFIVFDPKFQKLVIHKSETTMANGKIVASPQNAFNEVLPGYATNSYSYNHLREMVVTHTGLEKNCMIELDYEIQSSSDFFPALMIHEMLTTTSPIEELEIIVKVPEDVVFNYQIFNLSCEPELVKKDGIKQFTWKIKNLKAVSRESMHTLNSEPKLLGKSGEIPIGNWFDAFIASDHLNDSIIRKVEEICSQEKEKKNQISEIQKFVSTQINYVAVPMAVAGYRSRTSAQVWNSNCGTELEKTILLYQMLKKAGFLPVPAGLARTDVKPEIMCAAMLNETGISLSLDGINYYLPATKPGIVIISNIGLNQMVVSLTGKDLQVNLGDIENSIDGNFSLILDKELIISGESNIKLKGRSNPYIDFRNSEEKATSLFSNANGMSVVLKSSIYSPDSSLITLKLDKYKGKVITGGYSKIILPEINTGFASWNIKYLDFERTSDLLLPFNLKEEYYYSIELPEDWVLASDSINYSLNNSFGDLTMRIYSEGKKVSIERKMNIHFALVHADEYKMARQLLNEWLNPVNRSILLKKTN